MFTGIVEQTGRVAQLHRQPMGVRLIIDPAGWPHRAGPGDSVAVNGCCLTHAPQPNDQAAGLLAFDVIKETLDKTSLGGLSVGDAVNLEAPLTPASPLGGHFVQGHVDGTGRIVHVNANDDERRLTIETDAALTRYIVPKGSVAVDGVSLTIAAVNITARTFDVALIPMTLQRTTLGQAKPGDTVNLETDMIARTVVHALGAQLGADSGGGLTMQMLRDAGFAD